MIWPVTGPPARASCWIRCETTCLPGRAGDVARGVLPPGQAFALTLWPQSLLGSTDAALATFEAELHEFTPASDDQVLDVVRRVVLALNKINDEHVDLGEMGYETGEREELCEYIDATLAESGIDVAALAARRGIGRWEITDEWRKW
jgi:hypothetical protein